MVAKYITLFLLGFTLASSAEAGSDGNVYISGYTDGSFEEASQGTEDAFVGKSYTDASMEIAQLGLYTYVFELYNADDEVELYLNNEKKPILTASYFENTSKIIYPGNRLYNGNNTVTLKVLNNTGGWTYGLRVYRRGALDGGQTLLLERECGQVGVVGCFGNNERRGLVFSKTYPFNRY